MKTIEIKTCGDCPMFDYEWAHCQHPSTDNEIMLNMEKLYEKCPLKKEPITIKLKENEH